jgi:hypothetical protein
LALVDGDPNASLNRQFFHLVVGTRAAARVEEYPLREAVDEFHSARLVSPADTPGHSRYCSYTHSGARQIAINFNDRWHIAERYDVEFICGSPVTGDGSLRHLRPEPM